MANHAAEEKPLRKMAEAFKDLANTLNSQTLDEAAKMEVAPFSHACTFVSPLFRCLGIAFKFAELDYVAKVGDLAEASKSITTLHTMMDQDIQANCVRKAGSHTRNLLKVKRGLDMVKVLFEEIIAAEIEVLRSTFFWQGNEDKRKYHLVKWEEMNISKKIGGNQSLMMKWLWKFASAENSLWKEVIAAKYGMRDKWMTTKVTSPYGSSAWRSISDLWDLVLERSYCKVGNGRKVVFWMDKWCGQVPLSQRFPDLYDLCQMQQATVAELWNDQGWNLHFRRNLNDWEMCRITEFLVTLPQFSNLSEEEDSLVWNVGSKGCFTVNSAYEDLNTVGIEEVEWPWKMIWKTKIPYKGIVLIGRARGSFKRRGVGQGGARSKIEDEIARGEESVKKAEKTSTILQLKVDTPKKSRNLMGLGSCTVIVMGQCRAGLSGAEQGETVNHLFLHCKWTTQLWQMFTNMREIKWVKPGRIKEEERRRDGRLSHHVYGGQVPEGEGSSTLVLRCTWKIGCLTSLLACWCNGSRSMRAFEDHGGNSDGSSHESTLWLRNRYHRGNSLKDPASKAYTQVFAPYHGWAIRKAVSAGMYALPTRQQLMIKLNEDEDSARTQMQNYVASCETVITYIDKLFTSRDLGIDW
ncbi:hypothetical protein H5410_007299 [Solanum commersonii]|uniref:Glycolipid transfer protein domain-containing protein n=1 Tax=Solanum commersonii TaxID=4109 RepID=A0A9J6AC88_SOLCO|nr:hypothetical protein H5410_007299 [Solanum commersonii]